MSIPSTNTEFAATVLVSDGTMTWRRPEDPEPTTWTVEHAWPEGKSWYVSTVESGTVVVTRTGGCGCK